MHNNINSFQFSRSKRLWIAGVLGSMTAIGPLSLDMYLPSLPILTIELHTSVSLGQLSLTACLLGLALGQLWIGPLSDSRGRRNVLLSGLIVYTVASVCCAFVSNIWVFIILRFLQGLAGSAGIVISRAVARDLYEGSELTKFFSLLMLVNGAAPILAPIIGGQLLIFTKWQGVFLLLSIIGFAMVVVTFFWLPETLPNDRRIQGGIKASFLTFRRLIQDRDFVGYASSQGLVMAAMFAYIAGSPFVLQTIFSVSPQGFSFFFALNGLGIILASQISGRLAGRVGETRLLVFGLFLASFAGLALLLVIIFGGGLVGIVIPLFFMVSSVGVVSTASFTLAMEKQARSAGSASALIGALQFVLGAVTSPLVGLVGSHSAFGMGIVIAIADVGAIVCYLLLVRLSMQKDY